MMDMMSFKNGMQHILIGLPYQSQLKLLQLNHLAPFHYWLVLLQVYIIPKVDFILEELGYLNIQNCWNL